MFRKDGKRCPERIGRGVQKGWEMVFRKDGKSSSGMRGKGAQEGWKKVSRKDGKMCPRGGGGKGDGVVFRQNEKWCPERMGRGVQK